MQFVVVKMVVWMNSVKKVKILDIRNPLHRGLSADHRFAAQKELLDYHKKHVLSLDTGKWTHDNDINLQWFGEIDYAPYEFHVRCIAALTQEQQVLFVMTFGKGIENAFAPY